MYWGSGTAVGKIISPPAPVLNHIESYFFFFLSLSLSYSAFSPNLSLKPLKVEINVNYKKCQVHTQEMGPFIVNQTNTCSCT